jgi:hypothetical protein
MLKNEFKPDLIEVTVAGEQQDSTNSEVCRVSSMR